MEKTSVSQSPQNRVSLFVPAPQDYLLGPVFAATKQAGPREVAIEDRRYLIGGFHPTDPDAHPPALDVRHARVIFSLLSFRDPSAGTRKIRFSFKDFCRRYGQTNGGHCTGEVTQILADLMDCYFRVTDLKTNRRHQYRLIERVDFEGRLPKSKGSALAKSNQAGRRLSGCTLSLEFTGLLDRIVELQSLDLTAFTCIRSPLAQAIYLYMPSRAYHHSERAPFEIPLAKLLEQVSFSVPELKSKRRQLFVQHQDQDRAVIQQLDGLKTLRGRFRVRLRETADGTDWKLQSWEEREPAIQRPNRLTRNSKLAAAFLASGRPREQLDQILAEIHPLSDYELEWLALAGVKTPRERYFFEIAKAILKQARFDALLAKTKTNAPRSRTASKNLAPRLAELLLEAIRLPTRQVPGPKASRDR